MVRFEGGRVDHRQCLFPYPELRDLDRRHHLAAKDAVNPHGRPVAQPELRCQLARDRGALGPGVDQKGERPLPADADHHRHALRPVGRQRERIRRRGSIAAARKFGFADKIGGGARHCGRGRGWRGRCSAKQ